MLTLFPTRLAGQGEPPAKIYRIGWLSATIVDELWEAFVAALRERGWVEGKNVAFERLLSEGRNERFPALAAELVRRNVDVIIAAGTPPALAARDATVTIPIVFWSVGNPVGSGLVASTARPGRNVTGLGGLGVALTAKQLEILKEMVPKASRIGVFLNSSLEMHTAAIAEMESAAQQLGVTLMPVEVRVPDHLDGAFASLARDKVDALFIVGEPFIAAQRERVAKLAIDHRIPTMSPFDIATRAGVLLSYARRLIDDVRRVPYYVDRIFKGAKPAELPVEQPTRFYLSINLSTAKRIGIVVPPSLLARADETFE